MKTMPCRREEEVVAAVVRGNVEELWSGHVASCENCRAAANITSLLQRDRMCKVEGIADIRSRNMIWTRATLKMRAKRKRIQRLGLASAIVLGALAGWLTSLVVLPSGTTVSFERTAVLLSHSLILLLPAVVVLAAVSLVLYADSHNPISRNC